METMDQYGIEDHGCRIFMYNTYIFMYSKKFAASSCTEGVWQTVEDVGVGGGKINPSVQEVIGNRRRMLVLVGDTPDLAV